MIFYNSFKSLDPHSKGFISEHYLEKGKTFF